MLADLFYLSAIWLVLSFVLVLLFGTRVKHSDPITSVLYLAIVLSIGDYIALWWLQEPFDLLVGASVVALVIGVILLWLLRDWNAFGQATFLFSLTTTI